MVWNLEIGQKHSQTGNLHGNIFEIWISRFISWLAWISDVRQFVTNSEKTPRKKITDGSCENCCGAVDLGSNTVSKPGKLAIDDGGGTFANWLNIGTGPAAMEYSKN